MAARLIQPAYGDELATLYLGDALEVLRGLPDASVEAVVTDPPAGISFMGNDWDTFPARRRREAFVGWLTEAMAECLRLLRPGGHALVWALPRTSGWAQTAIEDAGFEVRDVVHHLFAQGFPKSLDVGRAIERSAGAGEAEPWRGWGTALKPAAEHWILARRPLGEPNVAANVLAHGTGGLNIEACRVAGTGENASTNKGRGLGYAGGHGERGAWTGAEGRWPADVVLSHAPGCRPAGTGRVPTGTAVRRRGVAGGRVYSLTAWRHQPGTPDMTYADSDGMETVEAWECVEGCPVAELDRQSGLLRSGLMAAGTERSGLGYRGGLGRRVRGDTIGDLGGASRFFYVAKASPADRNAGLARGRNQHPTVKPVELMRWLVRLVTPPGGLVLDCFAGSGSTLVAAKLEGLRCIGVERDRSSFDVCVRRLAWARHQPSLLEPPAVT